MRLNALMTRSAQAVLVCGALLTGGTATAATMEPPIAVQTWTTRDFGTPAQQLELIKNSGVNYVETFGSLGSDATEVKALLDAAGLQAISAHEGIDRLRNELSDVIARQKTLGNSTIVMPWLPPDQRPTDAAGWAALGTELGAIATQLAAEGMTLGYHNHDFDLVKFGDKTALEILSDAAGPDLKIEVDVGWAAAAGVDPVDLLTKLSGRLFAIHAKDLADTTNPGPTAGGSAAFGFDFAAVGEGTIDWDSVIPAALSGGAEWFIIEHDFPPDAGQVISMGADYLSERLPAVPVPAGFPLLLGGMAAFAMVRRRKSS